MEKNFDVSAYITHIGEQLVADFERARQATTPSLVGEAMEVPVRCQLEQILPRGIAVGSGCVIDSYGNTSRQIDVILYERDICPVFSVNKTPETTYYPCEGVIAVGEIKSLLTANSLNDAFAKIASVKCLHRYIVTPPPNLEFLPSGERVIIYRNYGSKTEPHIMTADGFDQGKDEYCQIFGFVLSGELELKPQTLLTKFVELVYETGDALSPNLVVTLNDGLLYPCDKKNEMQVSAQFSAQTAGSFYYCKKTPGFRSLIQWIHHTYRLGQTSGFAAIDRYLVESNPPVRQGISMPKKG